MFGVLFTCDRPGALVVLKIAGVFVVVKVPHPVTQVEDFGPACSRLLCSPAVHLLMKNIARAQPCPATVLACTNLPHRQPHHMVSLMVNMGVDLVYDVL